MAQSTKGTYIKAGVETTYGVEQTTRNEGFGWIQDWSLQIDNQQKKVAAVGGGRDYQFIIDGVMAISGSFKYLLTDGRSLYYAIGSLTDDGLGNYSISATDSIPSLTIEIGDTSINQAQVITGAKIDTLTISSAKEDFLNVDIDYLARNVLTGATASTPVLPTQEPFMFWHGVVKKGGVEVAEVESFELKISNNLERVISIDTKGAGEQRLIDALIEKMRDITFRMTVKFNDFTLMQDVLGGTTTADSKTDTTIDLSFTAGSRSVNISLSGVRFNTHNRGHGAEVEVMTQDLDGDALTINISGTY